MRVRSLEGSRWHLAVAMVAGLSLGACFTGVEGQKEAPPGYPGGFCLAPDGACEAGACNQEQNFCYEPADPCDGFSCGGLDRGICVLSEDSMPRCQCEPGYHTRSFSLYCCPDDGTDPRCSG
jgi:hypothetical protein